MRTEEPDILKPLGEGPQSNTAVSNGEQRSLLPSSKNAIRCSSLDADAHIFSEETMQSLRELGALLQSIHDRLLKEGYAMKDGQLINPHDNTSSS